MRAFCLETIQGSDGTAEMDAKKDVGMEWKRDVPGCTSNLHQSAYCEKVIRDFGSWEYANCRREVKHRRLSTNNRSRSTSSLSCYR